MRRRQHCWQWALCIVTYFFANLVPLQVWLFLLYSSLSFTACSVQRHISAYIFHHNSWIPINEESLWCCMQPVWTLLFAAMCPIARVVPSARCSASCVNGPQATRTHAWWIWWVLSNPAEMGIFVRYIWFMDWCWRVCQLRWNMTELGSQHHYRHQCLQKYYLRDFLQSWLHCFCGLILMLGWQPHSLNRFRPLYRCRHWGSVVESGHISWKRKSVSMFKSDITKLLG